MSTIPAALRREVDALNARRMKLSIWELDGQHYVHVPKLRVASPPWGNAAHDIVIAAPLLYDQAALDAFYIELPYTYNNTQHPKIGGAIITLDGRQWRLVSWHYLDGKPWVRGKDSLETHIEHCRGFFLARGVRA